jgi:Domain of unknown function (DUF4224)
MTTMFLTSEELAILTGRKLKSYQIEALRRMGIPFFVNAIGRPVVARSAIEGGSKVATDPPKRRWTSPMMKTEWEPRVLREMREAEEREAMIKRGK